MYKVLSDSGNVAFNYDSNSFSLKVLRYKFCPAVPIFIASPFSRTYKIHPTCRYKLSYSRSTTELRFANTNY